jgi:uncharacterized protein YajQ (UPF0234 family)
VERGGVKSKKMMEYENNKLREIIAALVQEEVEVLVGESKEAIRKIVRAEFLPLLRSAVREAIVKELEEVTSQYRPAMEEEELNDEDASTATAESTDAHTAEGGLYLYGIAEASVQQELGAIGIEGNMVYTIPSDGLSVIVHRCLPEPYNSDDEDVMKEWVKTHQHVLDVASEKFGTVIPFGFDRIIKPEDNAPAEEVLMRWVSEEFDSLVEKLEKIRGRKEYGVQIFYLPSVMSEKIIEENEEIKGITDEMNSKSPGAAYMYKQKLESAIKREMESRMESYFKDFYSRIKRHVDDIKVEKTKKTDEKDMQMMMNLSCLVAEDKYKALGAELERIDTSDAFSVRFTGPWPAYSFVR